MKTAFYLSILLGATAVAADPFDESELFGDSDALVVSAPASAAFENTSNASPADASSTSGLSTSGALTSQLYAGVVRDYFAQQNWSAISHQHRTVGELLLDARSSDGHKAFAALEGAYRADSLQTEGYVRELFVDFHLQRRLYVRAGKQVLQWGRGNFWHPSDLINVEQKDLVERAGAREGTNGLRLHAPVGAQTNFYAFFDNGSALEINDVRSAFKAEFIWGSVETAVSIWKKSGLLPAYAWDASTRWGNWDLTAEAAFLPRNFTTRATTGTNLAGRDSLVLKSSANGAPRVAISAGRSFRFLQIPDRLRVQYEFYYNSLGYDAKEYYLTALVWLAQQGQIQPYSLGKYYAAGFLSLERFIWSDMTLMLNGVGNLSDQSYVLTGTLNYQTLHNLSLQTTILAFGGAPQREFTLARQKLQAQIGASLKF